MVKGDGCSNTTRSMHMSYIKADTASSCIFYCLKLLSQFSENITVGCNRIVIYGTIMHVRTRQLLA